MKSERPLLLAALLLAALPPSVSAAAAHSRQGVAAISAPVVQAPLTQGPRPLPAAENGVGRLVANVSFTDLAGKKRTLTRVNAGASTGAGATKMRATVVAFTSSSCPVSRRFAGTLARLEAEYRAKGVEFIFVDPIASDTAADLAAMAHAQKWQGSVVRDTGGTLVRALGARVTTQAFVLDAARTVIYQGAVSDQYGLGYARAEARQHYLADALEAVLAGETPVIGATTAPGCALAVPESTAVSPAAVTYYARIARVLQTNCTECHHTGGTGPFPLDTLESVRAHAAAIAQQVERRAMPPWSAAPPTEGHTTPWINDRSLPKTDRADLLTWLGGSRPAGSRADAPLPRSFASGWKIGRPDAQFPLPQPVTIKADGVMPYVNIEVPTHFTEDKWVNGLEIQPTNRGVVHHVLIFALAPDASGKITQNGDADGLNGFLAAYVPGTGAFIYPEGFAKKIPAGSVLKFQIHYTPNGTAGTDQTRLGLHFAPKAPKHEVLVAGIANVFLNIPAGAAHHPETGVIPVPAQARILGFLPHMHVRATACRYELVTPAGVHQTLLDVPQYDFNWQHYYRYADPVTVAKGSSIAFTGWFDNSAANPANPDPSRNVPWGQQTTDEMLLGYVEYYLDGPNEGQTAPIRSIVASLGGPKGITALFRQVDKNSDGKVTRDELPRPALFTRLDTNQDGVITLEEILSLAATGERGAAK